MVGHGEEGRGAVVRNAEGDLYAGHNGNVYKKTDHGWQSYNRDSRSWNDMQRPERPTDPAYTRPSAQSYGGSRDYAGFERDAAARRSGQSSFERDRSFGGNTSFGSRSFGGNRPRRR